jgi:dipeptidyl aminopeptidase/acylaminoacyl peptidase
MLYLPALIVAAVLMACAVVVLALSEKAEATFPGKNGRIAYASYDAPFPKGDSEIYTINPDGSGKTQLTNNDTDELDPAYSPDGKKIVYAGQDGPKGDLEIYTINASGGISPKSPTTMWTRSGLPTRPAARGSPTRRSRESAGSTR